MNHPTSERSQETETSIQREKRLFHTSTTAEIASTCNVDWSLAPCSIVYYIDVFHTVTR